MRVPHHLPDLALINSNLITGNTSFFHSINIPACKWSHKMSLFIARIAITKKVSLSKLCLQWRSIYDWYSYNFYEIFSEKRKGIVELIIEMKCQIFETTIMSAELKSRNNTKHKNNFIILFFVFHKYFCFYFLN